MQPGSKNTPKTGPISNVRKFRVGDSVWSKNFGLGDRWVPAVIEEVRGNVNYSVRLSGKEETVHRHIDQLKARVEVTREVETENSESYDFDLELPQAPSEAIMTPTKEINPILRRSTRVSKKPTWSKDFVSK